MGGLGLNYVIFHELGHSNDAGRDSANFEAYANTLGFGLATYAGVPIPPLSQMPGGYVPQ